MIAAAALVAGLVFALGLGLGGMTQPAKVIGFLDVGGDWDPSLACVMAGALWCTGSLFGSCCGARRPCWRPASSCPPAPISTAP